MAELRREEQQLKQLEIDVAVVTFQTGPIVENYVRETDLPWPALVDSDRSLYGAYGMLRGGVWDIWGPASWGTYIRLLLGGRKLHLPAGDVHQLGGDVLIDPRGVVRFHHVSKTPADRPPIASILDVVRQAPAGAGGHA